MCRSTKILIISMSAYQYAHAYVLLGTSLNGIMYLMGGRYVSHYLTN